MKYILPGRRPLLRELEGAERAAKMETSVTARYAGDRRDDFTYLQIDVGQMPAGVYKLTVAVKDARTGQTVARETLFRVVG